MDDLPVRLSDPAGGKRAVSGIEHLGTLPQREGLMSRYGAALSPSHKNWHRGLSGFAPRLNERGIGQGAPPQKVTGPVKTNKIPAPSHVLRVCRMPTKPSAYETSIRRAQEIRRIRVGSKLGFAVLVGVWLLIAVFVLMAMYLRWQL